MPPLLECRNLTVYRGERVALDGLTLTIEAGEHVAILGPNGSGKSTLIKTLTRECYPIQVEDPPAVRILGHADWDLFELRAMLGIVTNDLVAACTAAQATGRETIISGSFSSIGLWPNLQVTDAMRQRADEILRLLEVPHLADRDVRELSSGEGRRLVIGRALMQDPAALVLDEPSNSLDLRASYEVRDLVRKIAQRGTGVVLVTHHLPDIIPEIERVVMLQAGRIVRDGAKDAMLTSAALSALFGVAADVVTRDGYFHCW
jgi:iron complex transport system ATP-binding protein